MHEHDRASTLVAKSTKSIADLRRGTELGFIGDGEIGTSPVITAGPRNPVFDVWVRALESSRRDVQLFAHPSSAGFHAKRTRAVVLLAEVRRLYGRRAGAGAAG